MRYTKTYWKHNLDDAPILYISAFDDLGEVMRVEVFRDGEKRYADRSNVPEDGIWLECNTLKEVLAFTDPDHEFFTEEITQKDFENYWNVPENTKFSK
ncbi:DUF6881 domain-containing protein [Capnocytophaga catalasegens]|uniref:DUF6881 domain-containing protein n=1 Tax=Capnocytophaga catalasegens TaxID=1004260 RepID=A0AAV5AUC9_9FLAO|nr:hypothetical protein [Capnocytophaga catalasegens]GIZ16635.1 hypothetical protein RCZ03_26350 [Capnocytophaga catalasegens]GJM49471.1 hypothetical protein RCZ15_04460 [Capnocytophaga catalasegens]GJM53435.1 hypothetical protein RCZ16_17520 [Capnocytophaga catalasegens]